MSEFKLVDKARTVSIYLEEETFLKFRAMLTEKKKGFSGWVREKIQEELDKVEK